MGNSAFSSETAPIDTDTTLAGNSDTVVASQKATKGYVDTATGLLVPKSLFTTKGDLVIATASGMVVRHAAPANTKVTVADSTQTDGWNNRYITAPYATPTQVAGLMGVPGSGFVSGNGTFALVANTLYYEPWVCPFDLSITAMYVWVVTGVALTNVRIGIVECGTDVNPTGSALSESTSTAAATSATLITYTPGSAVACSGGKMYMFTLQSDGTSTLRAASMTPEPNFTAWGSAGASDRIAQLYRVSRSYAALSGTPPAWDTATYSTSAPWRRVMCKWTV